MAGTVRGSDLRALMSSGLEPGRFNGTLLLADISGYTSFLDNVRVAHEDDAFADGQIPSAYGLMSGLLDGIANRVDPPFTFVKFEGDAVFAVADDGVAPRSQEMLDCVEGCYDDFVQRLGNAGAEWTCTCTACSRMNTLDLKFVVHHGDYFVQSVGPRVEVLGPDVNIVHRLLKNQAASHVGARAYALYTDSAVDALSLPLSDVSPHVEPIDGMEPVQVRVLPLTD